VPRSGSSLVINHDFEEYDYVSVSMKILRKDYLLPRFRMNDFIPANIANSTYKTGQRLAHVLET
jgi:hypothetical protein